MRAIDELARLAAKIASGDMPADEPLFLLRGQDKDAANIVHLWSSRASRNGVPIAKCQEAIALAIQMDDWPVKQTPGRPETRVDSREEQDDL